MVLTIHDTTQYNRYCQEKYLILFFCAALAKALRVYEHYRGINYN